MKYKYLLGMACLPVFLSACGGGGSSIIDGPAFPTEPAPKLAPQIMSVTSPAIKYGTASNFVVTGSLLDQNMTVTSPTCANLTTASVATGTQLTITCTPTATGKLALSFSHPEGINGIKTAYVAMLDVPLPQVTMKTSLGDIVIELYPSNAPLSVDNFLQYTKNDFYKNLVFHRVISNFMVQGGGYNAALQAAPTLPAIKLESGNGLLNVRGSIAMARTNMPDSATSQFFINVVDNPFLDAKMPGVDGYAVFGKVVTGLPVLDSIQWAPTSNQKNMADVPVNPILINSVVQTQ